MKYPLIILSLFICSNFYGQKYGIDFSISNQNQVQRVVNEYFFLANPSADLDDTKYGNDVFLKYNTTLSYTLKDKAISFRTRLGYGIRNHKYEDIEELSTNFIDIEQKFYEISPSIGFETNFGRISLSTGIEIPFYFVKDITYKSEFMQMINSGDVITHEVWTSKMDGGLIWGVNNYINIRTQLYKELYFFTELNYGLLKANLGSEFNQVRENLLTDAPNVEWAFNKNYERLFFSEIQVQIGFGINLHKK